MLFRIHNSRIKRELPKRVESTADRWKNNKKSRYFFVDYIIQRFGTNNDCNKLRYPVMQNISYEFFNGMLFSASRLMNATCILGDRVIKYWKHVTKSAKSYFDINMNWMRRKITGKSPPYNAAYN